MATLNETAKYIRSKGAGPFWMTMDIFCENSEKYQQIATSKKFTKEVIAKAFDVPVDTVKIFYISNLNVVKVSVPRAKTQGHKYEKDNHCGQQYTRILDIEL